MKRRHGLLAALAWPATLGSVQAQTPAPPQPVPQPAPARAAQGAPSLPVGELKSLGQERYQVGRIVVDKRARNFTVPGRVHLLDRPLEYLATSPGGRKAYEALLELDTSGTELNLACILIGLERDPNLPPSKPPGPAFPVGQRVDISVAWGAGGQRQKITAAEAVFSAEALAKLETIEWAYTGSFTSRDGSQFAADFTGTLISLITDPTGVIAAVLGAGLGPYGTVRGSDRLPPVGTAIELIVQAPAAAK